MLQFDHVLTDRGSRYAVSGGVVGDRAAVTAFLKELTRAKKFARATHHSWAVIFEAGGARDPVKNDDGEAGAGAVILRMLEREALVNHLVVVTRWYGGVNLGGDRFRHVQDCVRYYLDRR